MTRLSGDEMFEPGMSLIKTAQGISWRDIPQHFAGVQRRRSGYLPTRAGQPANGWRAVSTRQPAARSPGFFGPAE